MTRTSRTARRIAEIVETDRRIAVNNATDAVIADAIANAPLGYADLDSKAKIAAAASVLATLSLVQLRQVAIRWIVEQGGAWDWGTVDCLQARLVKLAAHHAVTLTLSDYEPCAEERAEAAAFCAAVEAEQDAAPAPAPRRRSRKADPRSADERARDRAELRLSQGAVVEPVGDGVYLVASNSRANLVHRVEDGVCSCEATGVCWHLKAVDLVEEEARIEDEAQREWARRGPTPQWAA